MLLLYVVAIAQTVLPPVFERGFIWSASLWNILSCKDVVVGGSFSLFIPREDVMVSLCVFPLPVVLFPSCIEPASQPENSGSSDRESY